MKKLNVFLIAGATLLSVSFSGVVIVANKDVSDSSIAASVAEKLFLGKQTKWSDGTKVDAVILKGGGVHQEFLGQYVHKTDAQFTTFWKQALFTGTGSLPKSFASEDDVLRYVASQPGAVGYVSSGKQTAAVKVITVN